MLVDLSEELMKVSAFEFVISGPMKIGSVEFVIPAPMKIGAGLGCLSPCVRGVGGNSLHSARMSRL